ncbi:MAG TPA: hypothetical protein VGE01_09775 [Fimbriimonas sp.]
MRLNQYVAERRLAILEDLKAGHPPREGHFDETMLIESRTKGAPQMGSTHYEPESIHLEFIFPDPLGAPLILCVALEAPERIVFLPVPEWVLDNIWQGEIDGSHQFESDAFEMVRRFQEELEPERNRRLFGEKLAIGKA